MLFNEWMWRVRQEDQCLGEFAFVIKQHAAMGKMVLQRWGRVIDVSSDAMGY